VESCTALLGCLANPPTDDDLQSLASESDEKWCVDLKAYTSAAELQKIVKNRNIPRTSSSNAKKDILLDILKHLNTQ